MKSGNCTSRLSVIALGISLGIVLGLFMLFFALLALWTGHGAPMIAQWAEVFPGYAPTLKGGLIGGLWGYVEGLISGIIFAWVYNFCLCCCKSMSCGQACDKNGKK